MTTSNQNSIFASCLLRQENLQHEFLALPDAQARYDRLMMMGRALSQADKKLCLPQNLVSGCQSEVYLSARFEKGKVYFSIYSEALISSGLAALLLAIYDGESLETILKCPPDCIRNIGILTTLSPGRSNGLASMYLKMKQECIHILTRNPVNTSSEN